MRTLQELAQEAIAVQDASNLSGVVHGFSRAITDLRDALTTRNRENLPLYPNTDTINNHPICRMWADKIAHLTGTQDYETNTMVSYDANAAVCKLAQGSGVGA